MLDAYLARLGLEREPPSDDYLARLHRAHVERVPYETLWIHTGERWSIDVAESVQRIAEGGRGGYCFHLNGAFSWLLSALGFEVARHVGGVHGPEGPTVDGLGDHLVLSVGGRWYVDVGLGDALHDPLPLVHGPYEQPPWRLVLSADASGVGDHHLDHDPAGGFTGMSWRSAPAGMEAFAAHHERLSTSPESGFVRVLTVQTRDATGVDCLRGRVLKRIGAGASDRLLESATELVDVLGDRWGLSVPADRRTALWDRVCRAHDAWVAAEG